MVETMGEISEAVTVRVMEEIIEEMEEIKQLRNEWYRGVRLFSTVTELDYIGMLNYVKENPGAKIIYSCGVLSKSEYEVRRLFDTMEELLRFYEQNPEIKWMMTAKAFLVNPIPAVPSYRVPITAKRKK